MNAMAKKKEMERETEIAIAMVWPLLGLCLAVTVVGVEVGDWGVGSAPLAVPFLFTFAPPATPVSLAPRVLPAPVAVGAMLELASV